MEKIGEALGLLSSICYCAAICGFFVKKLYLTYFTKLSAEDEKRKIFQRFMTLILKYHRQFGICAGVFTTVHFAWQVINVHMSYIGALAAALMGVTVLFGIAVSLIKSRKLIRVHRIISFSVLIVILVHVITKL